jgi:hypothetical protein
VSDELSRAWAQVQGDRVDDLLDEIGSTWWRVHKLATELDEEWAWTLDAVLLETKALAREMVA